MLTTFGARFVLITDTHYRKEGNRARGKLEGRRRLLYISRASWVYRGFFSNIDFFSFRGPRVRVPPWTKYPLCRSLSIALLQPCSFDCFFGHQVIGYSDTVNRILTFEIDDTPVRAFHLDGFVARLIALQLQIRTRFVAHETLFAFQHQNRSKNGNKKEEDR